MRSLRDETHAQPHAAMRATILPGVGRPAGIAPDDDLLAKEMRAGRGSGLHPARERHGVPARLLRHRASPAVGGSPRIADDIVDQAVDRTEAAGDLEGVHEVVLAGDCDADAVGPKVRRAGVKRKPRHPMAGEIGEAAGSKWPLKTKVTVGMALGTIALNARHGNRAFRAPRVRPSTGACDAMRGPARSSERSCQDTATSIGRAPGSASCAPGRRNRAP